MDPSLQNSSLNGETKPYACTTCVQRKVRCDKHEPCGSCTRSRLQCNYRSTPPPLRRKRKIGSPSQALVDKIRAHEVALKNAGLPFEAFDESDGKDVVQDEDVFEAIESSRGQSVPAGPSANPGMAAQASQPHRGILISEHGGRRYYERGLFGTLGQQYRQEPIVCDRRHSQNDAVSSPSHASHHGSPYGTSDIFASSVLMGPPVTSASPRHQHPSVVAITNYWSIFVNNVHPLTKIIHAPTTSRLIVHSTSGVARSIEALRFSIYACAAASVTDAECQRTFGRSQAFLLNDFQSATRDLLFEGSFLRVPDIDQLCAHVLLLTSMLNTSDPSSLWVLMGSLIRMAQSQGLHRDGASLGLPPFEIEMRRRIWWYVVTLDGRLTELMGSESSLPKSMDTLLPSNINDGDFGPDMVTAPQTRIGASEMTFCLCKYEFARFLMDHDPRPNGAEPQASDSSSSMRKTHKPHDERSVTDLESYIERKFLRFCDPVRAVQFLTSTLARSALCKLRQLAQHRTSRHYPDDVRTLSSEHNNRVMNIAARNIEYDNLIHSNRSLRGFLWHVRFYFPWGAPIFLLHDLASRPDWDDNMQAAWAQVEELHHNHPEYIEQDKVIHLILGGMTIKAWTAREAALEAKGMAKVHPPDIVVALQARQDAFWRRHNDNRTEAMRIACEEIDFADMSGFDANFELVDPTFMAIDWSNWCGD